MKYLTIANANVEIVEFNNERVLTTEQLAEVYECDTTNIKKNFNANKDRFIEGKHYFKLEGEDLRAFKNEVTESDLVGKNASVLYLWTRRGASRHCKMLGTDNAWEMFDCLEENYFNPKQDNLPSYQIADPIERAEAWIVEEKERQRLLTTTKQQEQVIGELKPKADYTDTILDNDSTVPITNIAKDYGLSGQAMNDILHELGIIYKLNGQWLLYSKYQSKSYTHSKTIPIYNKYGELVRTKMNTEWTQKGRLFLYHILKEKKNLLPLIEQETLLPF